PAELVESVVVCDEGRIGEKLAPGPSRERIRSLESTVRSKQSITVLERHSAVGIYEGPLVPLVGEQGILKVSPRRVVVATGAVEAHGVFEGNDIPGVWLGRGAARLAGAHSVRPGSRAVVVAKTAEGRGHTETLRAAGVEVAALLEEHEVVEVQGKKGVRAVVVEGPEGRRRFECDALVLSLGFAPRDDLLRMAPDESVVGAGEVVIPGCTLDEAADSGTRAGRGNRPDSNEPAILAMGAAGYVCICEDVSVKDLEQAWDEGWRSSEILKRYTTATMGPCQGAMCGLHLSRFATTKSGSSETGARTTSRPPARPVRLEDVAAGAIEIVEKRTSLHGRHLELGARVDWSGSWKRPFDYGDAAGEYRAVRERVSVMDVGTLGKFLVAGPDAFELLNRVFPLRLDDLAPGRSRYMLALGETGYVFDDGLASALDDGYYVTSTSGGAGAMDAWLRDWTDRWGLRAHVVDQTAMLGAILLAGPRARDLLSRVSSNSVASDAFPYMSNREITVGGVPCRGLRVGFVGELAFELHHPRSRGVELWDALLDAGDEFGIRPHGLDALEVLRLEKGHPYIGQDTLPDDTPSKLGMEWALSMDKPFVGRMALQRIGARPIERRLVGLRFEGERIPPRGAPLWAGGLVAGRLTSSERSPVLGSGIGLGWVKRIEDEFPSSLLADGVSARVAATPFYDPEGSRLRG
ncbi:MAG: glycine cleavage T C-terminal barrel domain-containing protein, partial [Actinomycetota bacterium]